MAKILCVDDDPDFLSLADETLRAAGHQVATASGGARAVSIARSAPLDLIVTDVLMPEIDGWTLIKILRSEPDTATIPVVFLTQLGGCDSRLCGFRLGADDYLPKPFHPEELALRVDKVLRDQANARRISRLPAAGDFSGRLETLGLAPLLVLLEQERKTGRLELRCEGETCQIGLRAGSPVSAQLDGVVRVDGEDALFVAVDWSKGDFSFVVRAVTEPDEITSTVSQLLLRAATGLDNPVFPGPASARH